jgi:hypothetical protein
VIGTSILYSGLAAVVVAMAFLVRASSAPGRWGAVALLVAGVALALAGARLPSREHQGGRDDRIDRFLPRWHFNEVHETIVHAPPATVMKAARDVTAREIRFLRGLMAIRGLGLRGSSEDAGSPVLEIARRGGFIVLDEDADREVVFGVVGQFWRMSGARVRVATPAEFLAFGGPGHARAAINFRLEADGPRQTRVTTETRILALDDEARRKFGAYWRLIYPGSAIIRRSWLAAIKARAEANETER